MSKFDVSDFDADQLNQEIDDTNFPNSRHASFSAPSKGGEENGESRNKSQPMPVKPNGFAKSFDDEVFDVPSTPRTPRSLPTSGNCECNPPFSLFRGSSGTLHTQQPQTVTNKTSESSADYEVWLLNFRREIKTLSAQFYWTIWRLKTVADVRKEFKEHIRHSSWLSVSFSHQSRF